MSNKLINERCGLWKCEQEMGSGGFGCVTAWINQSTGEKMVIKQCKNILDKKNRGRWEEEIYLMNTIQHKNVVSGRPIPEEIEQFIKAPEKLLGLEYCESDLRKLLGRRVHCCGLQEQTVLNILRDVSCGLEFLHKQRIVHRDLKPENILLYHHNNEIIFKITDLGYAKVLDANSIAKSFVGTIQYLAPELFIHQSGYNYTADFWSLGTVIFECITGHRPFLLTNKAFDWPKYMVQKSDEHIWGYYDETVNAVKFFKEIPSPNFLSEPLLTAFRDWLKIVLRVDPKHRGNARKEKSGTLECFTIIQDILSTRLLKVFNVLHCKELTYTCRPGDTGLTLKMFLFQHLDIETQDQLLMFPITGRVLDNDLTLESMCQNRVQSIYLFNKQPNAPFQINPTMPEKVRELMGSYDDKRRYTDLRPYWAQALYCCIKRANDYGCLQDAQSKLVQDIRGFWEKLLKQKEILYRTAIKLESTIEMFNISYHCDLGNQPEKFGPAGSHCITEWETLSKSVDALTSYRDLDTLDQKIAGKQDMLKSLQKDILQQQGSQVNNHTNNDLEMFSKEAGERYDKLREKIRDPKCKDQLHDSTHMYQIMIKCVDKTEGLYREYYRHLRKILGFNKEISMLMADIQRRKENIEDDISRVQAHQQARQGFSWKLLSSKGIGLDGTSGFSLSSLPVLLQDKLRESLAPGDTSPTTEDLNIKFRESFSSLDHMMGEKPKLGTRKSKTIDVSSRYPPPPANIDRRRTSMPVKLNSNHVNVNNNMDWTSQHHGYLPDHSNVGNNKRTTNHLERIPNFEEHATSAAAFHPNSMAAGNHHPQSGTHHQQAGGHPQQPGTHHHQPSTHPQQPGTHHHQPGSHKKTGTYSHHNMTGESGVQQHQQMQPGVMNMASLGAKTFHKGGGWVSENQPPSLTNINHVQLNVTSVPSARLSPTHNSPRVSPAGGGGYHHNTQHHQEQYSFNNPNNSTQQSASPRKHTLTHTIGGGGSGKLHNDSHQVRK